MQVGMGQNQGSYLTEAKILNFSKPYFPYFQNGFKISYFALLL